MYRVSGIDLRTVSGVKGRGEVEDIRLEAYLRGRWVPVKMELALFLVDFFAENERVLQVVRPHWRQNGDRYFISKCIDAVRRGWRAVADEIERQRRGAA